MLSIYVHIPFCRQKCAYCAFTSFPQIPGVEDFSQTVKKYLAKLDEELAFYAKRLGEQKIKSIAFGGGTPTMIGAEGIKQVVKSIQKYFTLETIAELSIEANPFPQDEIIAIVRDIQYTYKEMPRIRRSFGIQTFDNEILQKTGRPSSFAGIVDFLRALRPLKKDTTVINLDFMAFGKSYDEPRQAFFEKLVKSKFVDSFSVYTLEIQEGSQRKDSPYGTADQIADNFFDLKECVEDAGYVRYEISNFAKPGLASVHNNVYRQMEPYLGIGVSASSFLENQRWTNTKSLPEYLENEYDQPETTKMNEEDLLIESFFLGLRTGNGVCDLHKYISVLVPDYMKQLEILQEQDFLMYNDEYLALTDKGMDVAHTIMTKLLKKI